MTDQEEKVLKELLLKKQREERPIKVEVRQTGCTPCKIVSAIALAPLTLGMSLFMMDDD